MPAPSPTRSLLPLFLFLSALASAWSQPTSAFRGQLGLFLDLAAEDSVLSLTRIGSDAIAVEVQGPGESETRTLRGTVPPAALEKLITSARLEGVPVRIQDGAEATAPSGPPAGPGTVSGQRKNRLEYVVYQSIFSSYAYGPALVNALDLDGSVAGATILFGVTGSIVGHSIFGYRHSFEDAHIYSLRYSAFSSIASSYLTSLLILGDNDGVDRLGSGLILGAYPLSLWLGYRHGDAYVDNPGRVDLEPAFAFPFAIAGAYLPAVYFGDSDVSADLGLRMVAGQALAFGVAGHLLSHQYRRGERIPQGIPGGIVAHTLLGFLAGLSLTVSLEPEDARVAFAIPLAFGAAGFGEGLWFFKDRRDNLERANFSWLGMLGGATFAGGILTLAEPDEAAPILWALTAGATAGYGITYALLKSQVETARAPARGSWMRKVEVNPLLVPERVRLADGSRDTRYRVPGLKVRF